MSASQKRHFRCVRCGTKTSTTDPARAAVKVCIRCQPVVKAAAVKTMPTAAVKTPQKATVKTAAKATVKATEKTKASVRPGRRPKIGAPAVSASVAMENVPLPAVENKPDSNATPVQDGPGLDGAKTLQSGHKKKMGALDAAAQVLRNTGVAMTPREIFTAILEQKLWASPKGKTPDLTIGAAMGREIQYCGASSRFMKAGSGKFAANPLQA